MKSSPYWQDPSEIHNFINIIFLHWVTLLVHEEPELKLFHSICYRSEKFVEQLYRVRVTDNSSGVCTRNSHPWVCELLHSDRNAIPWCLKNQVGTKTELKCTILQICNHMKCHLQILTLYMILRFIYSLLSKIHSYLISGYQLHISFENHSH